MDDDKVAVISCSLGGFDAQPKHVEQSIKADYFYFNDENFPLRPSMTPRLQAKVPKMFGWQLKPDYDYYLWLDGNMTMNNPDFLKYFLKEIGSCEMAVIKHHRRDTIKWETRYLERALNEQSKYMVARYENEQWKEQLDVIQADDDFDDDWLFIGGVFMYRNTKIVQKALTEWWYHVSRYCIQDQISMPYMMKDLKVKVLDHDYTKWDFITYKRHGKRES